MTEEQITKGNTTENSQVYGINLLFGKWDLSGVAVEDPSLKRYINLDAVSVPHSCGRSANKWLGNISTSVVERLINKLMRTCHYTGMKSKSYKIVMDTFEIIHKRTKTNPVQILVNAIENTAPREETTRLRFGGVSVLQAVDTAPSRRLSIALQNITKGAVNSSFKSKKRAAECLANEIMNAAEDKNTSFAVSKKNEIERIAASAR